MKTDTPESKLEFLQNETLKTVLRLGAMQPTAWGCGSESEPLVALPGDQKLISLAQYLPPRYIGQSVTLLEANSFAGYVNRYKTDNTLIFAQVHLAGVSFTAMLDYHGPAPELKPARCRHQASFKAIPTPEWLTWTEANGHRMNQVEFATFLEDNAHVFVDPTGAELLELVRSLHGHRNARFNTALRLDNGAYSVAYDEDIVIKGSNVTKGGELTLPAVIKAGMAVFQGAEPYEVPARLKTRCQDRSLELWYETIRPHQIVRESILLLVKQIAEQTKIVPLLGNP